MTWLPKSRAVLLSAVLLILSSLSVSIADDNLGLSVNSMPLSVFAAAIEEGMSVSIDVEDSIKDVTVDGQFNGSIETLLDELHKRFGITHAVTDSGYKLVRDATFASRANFQFQLSDMELITFLSYLSQAAGLRLTADKSININVNGTFNGTLQDIINALSNQYPVLFYLSDNTISVVPESSFVKRVVLMPNDNYSSEAFLTDLRTKLSPGNFVNRQDNQLIVGGHPEFVELTALQLEIDMAASATQTSNAADLVTAQFPLISNAVTSSKFDLSESKMPYVTAAGTPATYVESNDGAFESADLLFETAIAAILNMGDVLPAASTQGATQGITQAKVVARENSADTVLPTTLNRQLGVANAPVSAISKLNRTKSGNEVSTIQNPGVSEFIPLKEGIVTIPDNEVIDFAIQESEVGDSNTRGAGLSEGVSAQTNSEEEVAKQTGEVTSVDEIPGFY